MTPAFTYADGLPLDLGEHGLLGSGDDVFGDLFADPVKRRVEAPSERFGSTSPPQVATDALADRPEDGDGEPIGSNGKG